MILIIGGGVIGLASAYRLAQRGEKVHLVERGQMGREASWAAAGMLAAQVEAAAPGPFFDAALASRELYPGLAEELIDQVGIDIEVQHCGIYRLAWEEHEVQELQERKHWQEEAGLVAEWRSVTDLRQELPGVGDTLLGALYVPGDKQLDNRKLVAALREANRRLGVQMVEGCPVTGFLQESGRIVGVTTTQGNIYADRIVVSAGAWSGALGDLLQWELPIFPVRGEVLELEADTEVPPAILFTPNGYVTPKRAGRVLVGATEERAGFDRRNTVAALTLLGKCLQQAWPQAAGWRVTDSWAGFRPGTPDGLPLLGTLPGHPELVIATGHYRNGILLAPLTAEWIADFVVTGGKNVSAQSAKSREMIKAFAPDRFQEDHAVNQA